MASIELNSLTLRFPDGTVAVKELTLEIEAGETMVLVGPSGCGKTSTLRLIAGLETATSGQIRFGQQVVNGLAAGDRNVAMMFQSDALYPHMSVRNNLAFGMKVRRRGRIAGRSLLRGRVGGVGGWFGSRFGFASASGSGSSSGSSGSSGEIEERIRQTAGRLGIESLLDRKPHQLSGGERQRVALGRAMMRDPAVFLLDEPLSRLDAALGRELRGELKRLFRELGKPVLYVTHDQREAMALGDRLAVMGGGGGRDGQQDKGRLVQVGKPLDVYQRPANLFVAAFVGDVPMNVVSRAAFCGDDCAWMPSDARKVGFRAEDAIIDGCDGVASDGGSLSLGAARVRDVERMGDHARVFLEPWVVGDSGERGKSGGWSDLVARCASDVDFRCGDRASVSVSKDRLHWFGGGGNRLP